MKNVVLDNSVIVRAGLGCATIVKSALKKADEFLWAVNKYSIVDDLFQATLRSMHKGFAWIYADATLIKSMRDITVRYLHMIVEVINSFFYDVYRDSFVMNFFGKVVSGSRWIR